MHFQRPHHLLEHLAVASPTCLLLSIEGSMPRCSDSAADQPLPKGGFRKRVDVPAVRAAGPATEEVTAWASKLSDWQSKQVLLECDYALDDKARSAMQTATRRHPAAPVPDEAPLLERYTLDQFRTDDYKGITVEPVPWRIQRDEVFILNLYCGVRRKGDVQDCLSSATTYAEVSVVVTITVLSIDVAIDADRCDLMKSKSLAKFTTAVYARQVIMSGGGPPCETWSASRWSDLPGPPPLRTHDAYWGIKVATERRRMQLGGLTSSKHSARGGRSHFVQDVNSAKIW